MLKTYLWYTVKPPIGKTPLAEHTADTEQFPWSQHAPLTYRRFQLRNNFCIRNKNLVPNPSLIWSFYCIGNHVIVIRTSIRSSHSCIYFSDAINHPWTPRRAYGRLHFAGKSGIYSRREKSSSCSRWRKTSYTKWAAYFNVAQKFSTKIRQIQEVSNDISR